MSGEITPIPIPTRRRAAGTEVSTEVTATPPAQEELTADPVAALAAAIGREFPDLRQSVETLVWRMYGKWGRADTRSMANDRAAEVLQEVVARAWRNAHKYDPSRSAHAWLLRFAINVLQEQERAEWQHKQARIDLETEQASESAASAVTMLDRLHDLKDADDQRLKELLDLVSAEDAALIRSAYVENMSGREMAAALAISPGAARVRLSRAVQRFKLALRRADQFDSKDQ